LCVFHSLQRSPLQQHLAEPPPIPAPMQTRSPTPLKLPQHLTPLKLPQHLTEPPPIPAPMQTRSLTPKLPHAPISPLSYP
ncbi:hypothetical protein H0H92_000582, partial [Tricholoma furcatifolium]